MVYNEFMIGMIISFVGSALALFITAQVVSGFEISNLTSLIIATIVMGFINAFIKPALKLVSLPITIITLGLFTIVINAVCLLLATLVVPGFAIQGIVPALLGAIVLSIVSTVIGMFTKTLDKAPGV
jgi:putative membrane protein